MSHPFSRSAGVVLAFTAVVLFIGSPAYATGLPQQAGGVAGGLNNWYTLAPGQSVEWVFRYPGGDDPALIAFGADPANSTTVSVYNGEQWRALGAGDWSVEPAGRGTSGTLYKWSENQDLINNGNLFWEAVTGPAQLFHIQITNASRGPSRYWIAQGGSGAGELTLHPPVAATSPTSQLAAAVRTAAAQSQPPQTLPITGGASLILSFGAGLVLMAAGWLLRHPSAR